MSLRFKTVIGVALIEALLLALLIGTVVSYQHDSAEQALLKRAQTTATLFASTTKDPLLSLDLASLEAFSAELLDNPDLSYVRVLDQSGLEYAALGDEIALQREFAEDTSLDDVSDHIFDVSATISEGGINFGRVELGFDIGSIREVIAETRELSITIAVVEMALVALFSFMLGTYLTSQLKVLRKSAKDISKGNYSSRIDVKGKDEITEVANAFNHMSGVLQATQHSRDKFEEDLIELNQTLEQRVERRTCQLQQQMAELEAANRKIADTQAKLIQSETLASVGQMAAGIAHEINNPIGFVRSNLTSLVEYVDTYQSLLAEYASLKQSGPNQQQKIATIEKLEQSEDIEFINEDIKSLLTESIEGTTRVRDIVQGLKNFFPEEEQEKSLCDLNDCITAAAKELTERLQHSRNITTTLNSVAPIKGDAEKLAQAIVQVLENADHAVDENGEISVTSEQTDTSVIVKVTDNGVGIDADIIDRIFDPFYTTRDVGQGTGLGLAVCYGTVKNHNGVIEVESEPGVGTTFTLQFPLEQSLDVAA